MGLLAQRWEQRNDPGWLNRDDGDDGHSPLAVAGVRVNRSTALGLTTVWRCWDLISSAIAMAPRDVIVKVGGKSFPEFAPPDWLATPDPTDPTMTADAHFGQVALSLIADGNFFTHVYPHVLDPQVLTVLDPGRVDVKPGPTYVIKDELGHVIRTVGPEEMLHGWWIKPAGARRGIAPLDAMRVAFGAALATQEQAARFFGQGASLSFGVEVPGPMDRQKKDEMRENLRKKYAGLQNSHAIGVLTHGAKFVTGLTPTPEQAQFLATREFGVEDLSRPYGVPAAMANSTQPGAASFASTDNYDKWFKEHGVQPRASTIESQYRRLLQLPPGLTPPASIQFKFNLDVTLRSSLTARYQSYGEGIQKGFLTPNEARALEDLQAIDGGDELYMQQQMVPITKLGQVSAAPFGSNQP